MEHEYMHLMIYDGSNYSDYEEAKASGAIYTTESYIDALNYTTGVWDTLEIVAALGKCVGNTELVAGIETPNGFLTLQEIAERGENK